MRATILLMTAALLTAANAVAQPDFVNWENPHVHPLEITPDGRLILAVNTPDNRLEVFDLSLGPVRLRPIAVGLDPVSVRVRNNNEAWVVNHISDSVSVVNLTTGQVATTVDTEDEPCDVVFAGSPERAFVSCSQANSVLVYDPANLQLAPQSVAVEGEDPRALAVSADGSRVYVAIFESGNRTTILSGGGSGPNLPNVVNDPLGPYGGVNPPPNDGSGFNPPLNPMNPAPIRVGLIVRKDDSGRWMDDNGGDWTSLVSGPNAARSGRPIGWDLVDHDLAILDAPSLSVSYVGGLMNICMALGINPASGALTVVGTEATNEVRFEPIVSGRFVRVHLAVVHALTGAPSIVDLNGHLAYDAPTVSQAGRDKSLGDPRGIAWNAAGTRGYVTGMGSNNVVVVDAAGARAGLFETIEVGEGPTGVVIDEPRRRLYVLNKFESSLSVIDLDLETEISRVPMFDPSPTAIKVGRKHQYDTHKNSGLGQLACASCHVDSRIDRLAWDLGNPAGTMKPVENQNCSPIGSCESWHPMKGPMTTQTLQDIIGKEPLHWRGDRTGIEEFNGAFMGLLGDDTVLTPQEMQEYEDFLATIAFPPNPYRHLDNTLPAELPLPGHFTTGRFSPAGLPLPDGSAVRGLTLFQTLSRDDANCTTCHTMPAGLGTNYHVQVDPPPAQFVPYPVGPDGELHHQIVTADGSTNVTMKVPQLRNLYEKVGFDTTQTRNTAGFGFLHDGSIDSLARFVSQPIFNPQSDQDIADVVAFLLSFSGSDLPTVPPPGDPLMPPGSLSQDTHAAVGRQTTLVDAAMADPQQLSFISQMIALAEDGRVGLVVKGVVGSLPRGFTYVETSPGEFQFQSDRAAETHSALQLQALAAAGNELTYTLVPAGSQWRIGVDRDRDGSLDRDEIDGCSDPADPGEVPPQCANCALDADCDDGDPCNGPELCVAGACEGGPMSDCDGNARLDQCDLLNCAPGSPGCQDCDRNLVPDSCDVSAGAADADANGIPDRCYEPPTSDGASTRSITARVPQPTTAAAGPLTALRVRLVQLQDPVPPNAPCCPPPDFTSFEEGACTAAGEMGGCARWVGPPVTGLESQDTPASGSFRAARLQCAPYYHEWSAEGAVYIVGAEILPSSQYLLENVSSSCTGMEDTCSAVSAAQVVTTARWADVAVPFNPPDSSSQPDVLDITALVNKYKSLPGSPSKPTAQLQPNVIEVNADLNALDVAAAVDAFKSRAYPFTGPCVCPSVVPCNVTACSAGAQCAGTYGAGATCMRTCFSGPHAGVPCGNNSHCGRCDGGVMAEYPCDAPSDCPGGACATGTCGGGFCRDRCGRCE